MPWSKRLMVRETLTVYGASTYAGGVTYSGAATFQSTVGITGLLSLATGAAGGLKIGADCYITRGAAGNVYIGQTAGAADAAITVASGSKIGSLYITDGAGGDAGKTLLGLSAGAQDVSVKHKDLTLTYSTAADNSAVTVLDFVRRTTAVGNGAAGLGTGIKFNQENNAGADITMAQLSSVTKSAAAGTETNYLRFNNIVSGVDTKVLEFDGGDGTFIRDVTVGRDLVVTGDLTVNGATITADVANVLIEDKIITLNNSGAAASGGGVGLEVEEDAVITAYFKQAAARTGWELTSSAAPTRILSIITPTAASESLTMSGSLNVELDSAINQDLTTDATASFANQELSAGGALRTKTTAGNTLLLQAYNTNAGVLAYQTVGTLTTGDPPTFDLWTSTTLGTAYIYRAGGTDVPVADGGTGVSTFGGANTLLYTSAADTLTSLVAVNDGALVSSHVGLPTWLGPLTNGQVVIGSTGAIPVAGAITGTANQITVTLGAGTIALSGPQDLAAASSPTFAGLTLSGATQNGAPYFGAGGIITSTGAMTDGQLLVGDTGSNPILATLTGTANRVTVTNGAGSITLSGPQDLATTSAVTFGSVTAGTTPAPGAIQGNLKLQFFMGNPTVGTDNVFEELGNVIGTWAASAANFLVTAAAAPGGGRGSANSLHFACAGAALDGDYCSDARASVNWGGADQAGFWIYSVEGIAAGDVNFYVYDGTPGTTNEVDVGAVTAGVWTYVRVSLAGFTIADVDRLGFMLTAQGAAKTFTFDVNWISRWDETNTIALPQQVLYGSIHGAYYTGDQAADVHTAVAAVENTNYIINYNATGNEFISLTNLSAQILFMTYSYV